MNQDFYGNTNDTFSYLEFGAISPQSPGKKVYDFYTHAKAYDWFMNARYSNDIVAYQKMGEQLASHNLTPCTNTYHHEIHHPEDFTSNLTKYLALTQYAFQNEKTVAPTFFELGQTLFGCIEAIEFCQALLKQQSISIPHLLDLHDVHWYGLDISEYFNTLARLLHRNYKVTTATKQQAKEYSLFFAKGITLLYAIRSTNDLFRLLRPAKLSLFDYSLSLEKEKDISIGTGKGIRYLAIEDFRQALKNETGELWIRKAKILSSENRMFFEGVYGDSEKCQRYIQLEKKVRSSLWEKIPEAASVLLHQNANEEQDWFTFDDFLKHHSEMKA